MWKAAAGKDATLQNVSELERVLNELETELLTKEGVNCLRAFPAGRVAWGARTLSDDPEWKYIPVRRLALFIESSIARGLEWAVFEPNNIALWAKVRSSVQLFLQALWRAGALAGITSDKAFFVKVDETTMTQADIDNGRLNVLIGVAPLHPAEFVIIRIGLGTVSQ